MYVRQEPPGSIVDPAGNLRSVTPVRVYPPGSVFLAGEWRTVIPVTESANWTEGDQSVHPVCIIADEDNTPERDIMPVTGL